jgi:CTP-dependent riboflavin kinase
VISLVRLFWKVPYVKNDTKVLIKKIMNNKGEFGMGAVLSIATALIISAFILIPNMTELASNIMEQMESWWGKVDDKIFLTSYTKSS